MSRRVAAVAFGLTCLLIVVAATCPWNPLFTGARETLLIGVLAGTPSPAASHRKLVNMPSRNDVRAEIRQFLTTRRAKVTPEGAGLPTYGGKRRVPGLRREEVALLAGISIEYYTRLERGNAGGVSEGVLDGIARALQLDEVERAHLIDLVRTANAARPSRRRATPQRVRPSVQRLLDSMTGTAAFLRNGRLDILSANQLGYALYAPAFLDPVRPVNLARFVFLDRRSREFYGDWDGIAHAGVGTLRAEAGRDPYDRALTELVGELSMRSREFRVRWAAHDVDYYRSGVQPFHHPLVGDLTLNYDALELPADPGLTIVAYTAEPGSPAQQALDLLASWTSTPDHAPGVTTDTET
jgi:transcriptional regulator with XRE-family HTH domain